MLLVLHSYYIFHCHKNAQHNTICASETYWVVLSVCGSGEVLANVVDIAHMQTLSKIYVIQLLSLQECSP